MNKYVTGAIGTVIGFLLLIFSGMISNYLLRLYISWDGVMIPFVSESITVAIIRSLFWVILIFVAIEIIIKGWKG